MRAKESHNSRAGNRGIGPSFPCSPAQWESKRAAVAGETQIGFSMHVMDPTLDPRFSDPDVQPTAWADAQRELEQAKAYWLSTVRTGPQLGGSVVATTRPTPSPACIGRQSQLR